MRRVLCMLNEFFCVRGSGKLRKIDLPSEKNEKGSLFLNLGLDAGGAAQVLASETDL